MSTPAATRRLGGLGHLGELLEMIKFQHALFALPFALAALLVAEGGWPRWRLLALVVGCTVAARTAAMTWNRIADRAFDAANPRTRDRSLPAGRVSMRGAWALLVLSVVAFVALAAMIGPLTLALAPVALVIVLGYSLAKRVTWATHALLGLALSIAPIGAWIASRNRLDVVPLLLGGGVASWTAGFDLLYACQDSDFDRRAGLQSFPARFGVPAALVAARCLHVVALGCLVAFSAAADLGTWTWTGVAIAGALMAASHALVSPRDLSRLGVAFFHANVGVSLAVLAGVALDVARLA